MMKLYVWSKQGEVTVGARFSCKYGHSPYSVSLSHGGTSLEHIIDYFLESTLRDAIRHVVDSGLLNEHKILYLMTGDGQEVTLTLENR